MADWKRQVAMLNNMGKKHCKLNTPAIIQQRKAEAITRLVDRMKARANV